MRLRQFVGEYLEAIIGIAALAGIIALGVVLERLWIIPVCLVVGVLIVGLRHGAKIAARYLRRFNRYPVLESQLQAANAQIEELQDKLDGVPASTARWVQEGQRQVVGAMLAAGVDVVPEIDSVSLMDGALHLSARVTGERPVPTGARFALVVKGLGEVKGILSVLEASIDGTNVTLVCVNEVVPEFWDHLRNEAARNAGPPGGVELARYKFGGLPGLDDFPSTVAQPTPRRRRHAR